MDPSHTWNRVPKRQRLDDENEEQVQHDNHHYSMSGFQALNEPRLLTTTPQLATSTSNNVLAAPQFMSGTFMNHNLTLLPHSNSQQITPDVPSQYTWSDALLMNSHQPTAVDQQHLFETFPSCSTRSQSANFYAAPPASIYPAYQGPNQLHTPWLAPAPYPQAAISDMGDSSCHQQLVKPVLEQALVSSIIQDVLSQSSTVVEEPPLTLQASDRIMSETVCFGMIPGIAARCDRKGSTKALPSSFPVELESSTRFSSKNNPEVTGQILSEYGQMVQGLLDEESLDLHVSCNPNDPHTPEGQRGSGSFVPVSCHMEITLYGPMELFDEIGSIRHQKQALTFMLRRERGWAFYDQEPDVWEIMDTDQGRFFLNRVSNASQVEEPPQCYGGIVADPMGLGKTLTMIALAATDLESDNSQMDTDEESRLDVPTTLIVVPPPLIGTWEEQLHVVEGGLIYRRHHREGRLASTNELAGLNIVLTTYHTISAEWNPSNKTKTSALFSVRWRRIILDEAHLIRNGNSRMSQAICALESKSRWAVTGTPIQNRLSDLATLFKFIRAHPYTDRRCFDADISRLWKTGEYQEAIKRLKRLSKCLLLRRDKGTVSLPPRRDLQCPVDFSSEERALYDKLRHQAIINIDEALKRNSDSSRSGAYVNVLQQIESLRLVCNLGLHYHTRHAKVSQGTQEVEKWTNIAQSTFNLQRDMEPMVCRQCSSTLEITETFLEDPAAMDQRPLFFSCLAFICADCAHRPRQSAGCGHSPCCAVGPVSTSGRSLESSLPDMQPQLNMGLPSKIEALIADIRALPPNEKCIVFSTWRLTLDIVEAGLEQASIPSVRFDGKVPQKDRQNIVDRFRNDPSVRVMLLTLSCGAAGLTLTVATRAYLMEPHWNPTLEEQALARIHRIGQAREVTTVRFFVRDSFEQQVIKVQESKKYLAGLLLSPHDNGHANENLGRLQELLSLI
ncbi:hypothetical protein FSARC_4824 [Fusarium sarcochroum]|uniref:Uncharacterized protein n=1 Tax=Fusarium sarcochroum TaxID=1208366 RepID=A0A8H4U171_9HYPO|nr:hypothetical protein FSARC_4824 [Fusarium sarcochroum]